MKVLRCVARARSSSNGWPVSTEKVEGLPVGGGEGPRVLEQKAQRCTFRVGYAIDVLGPSVAWLLEGSSILFMGAQRVRVVKMPRHGTCMESREDRININMNSPECPISRERGKPEVNPRCNRTETEKTENL